MAGPYQALLFWLGRRSTVSEWRWWWGGTAFRDENSVFISLHFTFTNLEWNI